MMNDDDDDATDILQWTCCVLEIENVVVYIIRFAGYNRSYDGE